MAEVGRPTKFTEETRQKLYENLRLPISLSGVARGSGISRTLMFQWVTTGNAVRDRIESGTLIEELTTLEQEYLIFINKFDEIQREVEKELIESIKREKGGTKFIIGNRFREDYAERTEVDVNANISGTVNIVHTWRDMVEAARNEE